MVRGGFYVGSGMAGLSRINDNHHYTSQVVLGWWIAYLAARSVNRTVEGTMIQPTVQTTSEGFTGLTFEKHW